MRMSTRMKLYALVAALGLVFASAALPDPDHRPTAADVQPAPFHSQHGAYFQVVDDGRTTLQAALDHVPVDTLDGVTRADRWPGEPAIRAASTPDWSRPLVWRY
jgi:hypothetical protein